MTLLHRHPAGHHEITGRSERECGVLKVIQSIEPPGRRRTTLRECLRNNSDLVEDSPWEDEARP
jgi:hypothetical protein